MIWSSDRQRQRRQLVSRRRSSHPIRLARAEAKQGKARQRGAGLTGAGPHQTTQTTALRGRLVLVSSARQGERQRRRQTHTTRHSNFKGRKSRTCIHGERTNWIGGPTDLNTRLPLVPPRTRFGLPSSGPVPVPSKRRGALPEEEEEEGHHQEAATLRLASFLANESD